MTVFGGRKRPLQIKTGWLKQWLQICENEHGSFCNSTLSTKDIFEMKTFRFVDVKEMCLRTFHNRSLVDFRYVALSYVWGAPSKSDLSGVAIPALELNASTIADLETAGSFRRMKLPQTLVDVIDLAAGLNVPFVWIDRLCIQQDSLEDKAVQISRMHAIYNASWVTVIAAAGNDVHHGLPGLRPGTRHAKQEEILVVRPCKDSCIENHDHEDKGFSLLTCVKSALREEHYLETTVWNQRGWTLQERCLARRNIIFTDQQVYWACSDATFCEEMYCELPFPRFQYFSRRQAELNLKSSVRTMTQGTDPKQRFWETFSSLASRFSQRYLSYLGDGHDAFAAILHVLNIESGDYFHWGIPLSRFELGLSWTTFPGQYRRTTLSTLPMTRLNRRVAFPSWSWLGWVGQTHITVGDDRLETEKPVIQCYVHENQSGEIRLIRVQNIAKVVQNVLPTCTWKSHEARHVSLQSLTSTLDHLSHEKLLDTPDHHLLFFYTSVAKFRVSGLSEDKSRPQRLLVPALNIACGTCQTIEQHLAGAESPDAIPESISANITEIITNAGCKATASDSSSLQSSPPQVLDSAGKVVGKICRMTEEHWKAGAYDTGMHHFIVVGRRHIEELGDEFPATLLVMQVELEDGIWYRVNIGEIEEAAWEAGESEWKFIVLG